ncbi:MAG: nitrite reductase small subunit NirD [Burkholderiaceae bacterium]
MNAPMHEWTDVCAFEDVPPLGARVVRRDAHVADVALFRTGDGRLFALEDRCPHKGGPLSQGIVAGERVTCPLHGWAIELGTGAAVAPDHGATRCFAVRVVDGRVLLDAAAWDLSAAAPRVAACPLSAARAPLDAARA